MTPWETARRGGRRCAARPPPDRRVVWKVNRFRLPDLQEQGQGDQADQGRGDVRQFVAHEVGGEVLGDGKGAGPPPATAGQVSRTPRRPSMMNTSQNGTNSDSSGSCRPVIWPIRNGSMPVTLPGDDDRNAEGAEGHRCGVGDQAQAGGVERIEAQAHQQCGGNRDRRAETGGTFQERAEAEADQHHLQALVVGNRQHRGADDLELAGLDRQFVEEHRRDDDPGRSATGHRGSRSRWRRTPSMPASRRQSRRPERRAPR